MTTIMTTKEYEIDFYCDLKSALECPNDVDNVTQYINKYTSVIDKVFKEMPNYCKSCQAKNVPNDNMAKYDICMRCFVTRKQERRALMKQKTKKEYIIDWIKEYYYRFGKEYLVKNGVDEDIKEISANYFK